MNGIAQIDKAALRREAQALHERGDNHAALDAFRRVLAADPDDVAALLFVGAIAYTQHRLDEAEPLLAAAFRHAPESPAVLNNYGLLLRARGRLAEAIELYRRAVALQPDFLAAHNNLTRALIEAQSWDEAIEATEALVRLDPTDPERRSALANMLHDKAVFAAQAGDPAAARQWVLRALGHAPDRGQYVNTLMACPAPGAPATEAIDAAATAWKLQPNELNGVNLWEACNRVGDNVPACRAATDEKPDDPFRQIVLGNALRRAGFFHAAEHAYRTAIALDPKSSFGRQRLAVLLLLTGRTTQADALLQQVAVIRPGREIAMRFDPDFLATLPPAAPPARTILRETPNDDARLLVFAACDGVYFERFASAWLHSVARNTGVPVNLHLHVLNPPGDIAARVDAWNLALGSPGIGLSVQYADTAGWSAEYRKTFFACARFLVLPELLRLNRPLLMLDVDLIVLRDLGAFLDGIGEGDVAVVGADQVSQEVWNWYWADVVYAAPTEAARTFFGNVAAYISHFLAPERARWFLDQIALAACLHVDNAQGRRPRLVRVPRDVHRLELKYADGQDLPPDETVLFWSAHASTVSTQHTLEMQRYQSYVLPWPMP